MPKVNIYHPCITRISYQQEKGDSNYGTCFWIVPENQAGLFT